MDPHEAQDNHKHQEAHTDHNDESRSAGDHCRESKESVNTAPGRFGNRSGRVLREETAQGKRPWEEMTALAEVSRK